MGIYVIDTAREHIDAETTHYEYGPFGEMIVEDESGLNGWDNPFQFSTKYQDSGTGLYYYGLRYYEAETGRWMNRDPIEEAGGLNLYVFVDNDPINAVDYLGLWSEVQREGEAWAKVCSDSETDTWDSLAKKLRLDRKEITKWIKGMNGAKPVVGETYEVPNLIVFYVGGTKRFPLATSDRAAIDSFTARLRTQLLSEYLDGGYRIETILAENEISSQRKAQAIEAWASDGIYGMVQVGHYINHQFILEFSHNPPEGANESGGTLLGGTPSVRLGAGEVQPPYQLGLVAAAGCQTCTPAGQSGWRSHVSSIGRFIGFSTDSDTFDFDGLVDSDAPQNAQ